MDNYFLPLLSGRDLRSNKVVSNVIRQITTQQMFDELFKLIFHHERPLVMRAADAIEKVTRTRFDFLIPHTAQILELARHLADIEVKWHIAQILPRLVLSSSELVEVWHLLHYWATNPNESKIVRVNALQSLHDIALVHRQFKSDYDVVVGQLQREQIPSIKARLRKLKHSDHE